MGLSQRCVKNMQARGRGKSVIEGMLMDVIFVPLAYAYARTPQGFCVFLLSQVSHFLGNSLLLCWLPLFYNVL